MAGSKSDYWEKKVLELMMGAVAYTAPTGSFIGLMSTMPGDATTGVEFGGANGYARASATNNQTTWNTAVTGAVANLIAFVFPTATSAWGTATGWALFEAAVGASAVYWGDLNTAKFVNSGDVIRFTASAFVIAED